MRKLVVKNSSTNVDVQILVNSSPNDQIDLKKQILNKSLPEENLPTRFSVKKNTPGVDSNIGRIPPITHSRLREGEISQHDNTNVDRKIIPKYVDRNSFRPDKNEDFFRPRLLSNNITKEKLKTNFNVGKFKPSRSIKNLF